MGYPSNLTAKVSAQTGGMGPNLISSLLGIPPISVDLTNPSVPVVSFLGPTYDLFTGSWNAVNNFTTVAWAAGAYRYIKMHVVTNAFNAGALGTAQGRYIGPAAGTYRSGGTWSTGVSGAGTFSLASAGSPGGLAALLLQDQLNVATAKRVLDINLYPLDGNFDCIGKAIDVAGSSIARTCYSNYTTDATPPTAFRVDWSAACTGYYWMLAFR